MQLRSHHELEEISPGRFRHTQYLKPIAYERNGAWRRINNAIISSGDPNMPLGTDELAQFRVKDRLAGQSPVCFFGRGASHIRWTPLNTNSNVNGVVTGINTIIYPGAWNNADLRLTIAGHILHKDMPLRTGHPSSFSFRLDAHQNFNVDTLSSAEFRVLPPILLGPQMQSIPLTWAKSVQGGKTVLTVTLPHGDYAGWTLDPTLTLQPDASDGVDTHIRDGIYADRNYGVSTWLNVGELNIDATVNRILLKPNLTSLPASAVITSCYHSLYALNDFSSNARTLRAYRQKRAWTEGTGDNTASGDGATWNTYDGSSAWQTAGGFGANDCEQTDIGSRDFTATETLNEFKNITLTPTTKAALDLGNGHLLKFDTESDDGYQFAPSDDATAANRPKLTVEYTVSNGALYRRFMMTR